MPESRQTRARVTLIVHAATDATATASFTVGSPLTAGAARAVPPLAVRVPRHDTSRHSPDVASTATHEALALSGSPDPDISPWDPGRWAGRTLDDVAAAEPEAVRAWLTDPDAVPHGGESLSALLQRVRLLLADLPPGHTLAVVDAAIVRAATVTVLGAPPSAFWRIDAGPLTVTDLRGGPAQWTVRATGRPLETY